MQKQHHHSIPAVASISWGLVLLLGWMGLACQPQGRNAGDEALINGKQRAGGDFKLIPGQRIGPLYAVHSQENDLVQTFGANNVKRQEIYLGEGVSAPGFVVFGDTRNALEVYYDTSIVKDRPAFVRIAQANTDWHTPEGISIGTSLEELVRINGKPITFWGFGWDFGGAVSNWNGGNIQPGLMIVLKDTRKSSPPTLQGEREISSSAKEVDLKRIKVSTINVRL